MNKKRAFTVIFSVVFVILTVIIALDAFYGADYRETGVVMGAQLTVKLFGTEKSEAAREIFDSALKEEENCLSRYKESSEIYKLNERGSLEVSERTLLILKKAVEICNASQGAYDITIGNLSSLWDFDEDKKEIPRDDLIKNALSGVGSDKIKFNGGTVSLGENQKLDLGSLGKGVVLDISKEILEKHKIRGAVISSGGSVLTYGKNTGGKNWSIGVKTPKKNDSTYCAVLSLPGENFISTSGNYEKSFTENNKIYHHILSPKTGYPAESSLKSVTVIAGGGLISDALSTACYVLGAEGSLKILKEYNAEAIFIDDNNDILATEGVIDAIEPEDGYKVSLLNG